MVLELIVFGKCCFYSVQDGLYGLNYLKITEPYKNKANWQSGWIGYYSGFPDCASKTWCHDINSTAWCVLCLLFMLLNRNQGDGKVITLQFMRVIYSSWFCFLGFLYHNFFSLFTDFFFPLLHKSCSTVMLNSVHKVAH